MRKPVIYLAVVFICFACGKTTLKSVQSTKTSHETGQKNNINKMFHGSIEVWPYAKVFSANLMGKDSLPVMFWDWTELGPFDFPKGNNAKTIGTGRINTLYLDPFVKDRMFACSSAGGLFVSKDGGEHWENGGTDFLPVAGVADVIVNPDNPNCWIIATGDGETDFTKSKGVYITLNEGTTWKEINNGFPFNGSKDNLVVSKILSNPKKNEIVFAATNKGLFRCLDIFAENPSWEPLVEKYAFYDIAFKPDNPDLVFASGDKIFFSGNGGKEWDVFRGTEFTDIQQHHKRTSIIFSPSPPYFLYAVVTGRGKDRKYYHAKLYQYNFTTKVWTDNGEIRDLSYLRNGMDIGRAKTIAIAPKNPEEVWVGNVNPIQKSYDGGKTWKSAMIGLHDDIRELKFSDEGKKLWAANDGGVYVSLDTGKTWIPKSNGLAVATVHAVSTSQSDTSRVVIGCYDTGSSVMDRSKTDWTFLSPGDGYGNAVNPYNANVVYTSVVGGSVYKSVRDSLGWSQQYAAAPNNGSTWQTWIEINPFNGSELYQCGRTLWRSSLSGARNSWEELLNVNNIDSSFGAVLRVYPASNEENVIYTLLLGKLPLGVARTFNATDSIPKWERITGIEESWVGGIAISSLNSKEFWITYSHAKKGNNNKIFKYTAQGIWQNITYNLPELVAVNAVVASKNNELYIGTTAGVFYLDGNKKEWVLLRGIPHCKITEMEINLKRKKIIVATFGRGVWEGSLIN